MIQSSYDGLASGAHSWLLFYIIPPVTCIIYICILVPLEHISRLVLLLLLVVVVVVVLVLVLVLLLLVLVLLSPD